MRASSVSTKNSRALYQIINSAALFAGMALVPFASGQKLITFDAPNSGTVAYAGTAPYAINIYGVITGVVTDNSYGTHGFVRLPGGQTSDFDAPGADPIVGCTCPLGINDLGEIVGYAIDTNAVIHGFVRSPDGNFTEFDAPGTSPGTGQYLGTQPLVINNLGVIAGLYQGGDLVAHGFIRTPDGKITMFDDPAAGTGQNQGTWPYWINDLGAVSGAVTDSSGGSHAFVRSATGKYSNFDFPGETSTGFNSTYINDFGVTASSYLAAGTQQPTGYERTFDGTMTTFQAPDAGTGAEGTNVNGFNLLGTTTGYVSDSNFENHSFVRYANGKLIVFDVPGQIAVPGSNLGATGMAVNALNVVAGKWHDASYVGHAYVWFPQ